MRETRLDRRDFHRLTTAALGGLATGSILGCNSQPAPGPGPGPAVTPVAATDKHLCRGLNECKGQGKGGENTCRGQGACATVADSACGGKNECKGLGGCGGKEGANECKGQGGCHIPLMTDPAGDSAWDHLRKKKEAEWAEKKLEFATAPVPAKAE